MDDSTIQLRPQLPKSSSWGRLPAALNGGPAAAHPVAARPRQLPRGNQQIPDPHLHPDANAQPAPFSRRATTGTEPQRSRFENPKSVETSTDDPDRSQPPSHTRTCFLRALLKIPERQTHSGPAVQTTPLKGWDAAVDASSTETISPRPTASSMHSEEPRCRLQSERTGHFERRLFPNSTRFPAARATSRRRPQRISGTCHGRRLQSRR